MRRRFSPRERICLSLIGLTGVSVVLFAAGAFENHSLEFAYLLWNLFLAWTPLIVSLILLKTLRSRLWSDWLPLILTMVWLLMLPNSFYMISDFVHVQDVVRSNLLYDVVMFTSFIFTGVLLGFSSLLMVHVELRKRRLSARATQGCIAVILLLCSFAIYLGRDLRWNSWDVLVNPAGILFDISDHLLHPLHSGMYTTTVSFFVLLGSLYVAGWHIADATRSD